MTKTIEWNGRPVEIDMEQRIVIIDDGGRKSALMYMPGMPIHVLIQLEGPHPVWGWDGDAFHPTFSPSILTRLPWGENRREIQNHVFVKKGMIQYLSDCTHEYAGKTIPLPKLRDWPEDMRLWDEEEEPR